MLKVIRNFKMEIAIIAISLIAILLNCLTPIDISGAFDFINDKWVNNISQEGLKTSDLITFLTIIIGVYLSILSIISTSQSPVIKVLIENNKEHELGHVVFVGIIENLLIIIFIILSPDFYYKNVLLLSMIAISIISFLKFVITLFYFYRISNNETVKSIDQYEYDRKMLFADLTTLKDNTKK